MRENSASLGSQAVIPAPPLAWLFHPSSRNKTFLFQTAEYGIQRPDPELNTLLRMKLNQFSDFVTMSRTRLKKRENKKLGTTLL